MTLLKRYQNGEYQSVWNEIRLVSNVDARKNQVMCDVALATMEKVQHNADLIAERLRNLGWRALDSELSDLRTPPSKNDSDVFDRTELLTGAPLPLSLHTFWQVVGGINWVWDYEMGKDCPDFGLDIPLDEMDPLRVDPPCMTTWLLDEWASEHYEPYIEGNWQLELAPDYLHKANISGGDPYSIALPANNPDPTFKYEGHQLPFVDYLRLAFKWAGFPMLEQIESRADIKEFVSELKRGLVEF